MLESVRTKTKILSNGTSVVEATGWQSFGAWAADVGLVAATAEPAATGKDLLGCGRCFPFRSARLRGLTLPESGPVADLPRANY
jgi:hypothetical protein